MVGMHKNRLWGGLFYFCLAHLDGKLGLGISTRLFASASRKAIALCLDGFLLLYCFLIGRVILEGGHGEKHEFFKS